MAYSTRTDIELIYGKENVERFADVDNNEDPVEITARIDWALAEADNEIESRLANMYAVPFSPVPRSIVRLSALLAGEYLFDTRRIVNTDAPDQISAQRGDAMTMFKEILSGQRDLLDPTTRAKLPRLSGNAPLVVND